MVLVAVFKDAAPEAMPLAVSKLARVAFSAGRNSAASARGNACLELPGVALTVL